MGKLIIKWNERHPTKLNSTFVLPGVNEIEDPAASLIKETDNFKGLQKKGSLAIVSDSTGKEEKAEDTSQKIGTAKKTPAKKKYEHNVPQMVEIVKETLNPELLLKWKSEDKRGKVQAAIKSQLKKVTTDDEKPSDNAVHAGAGTGKSKEDKEEENE